MNKTLVFFFTCFLMFHAVNEIRAQENNLKPTGASAGKGKHQVGEVYGGGKIFWLDATGEHGLIAAAADQSAKGAPWNPGKAVVTSANKDQVYSGSENSEKIITVQGTGMQYAARLCSNYTTTSNGVEYNDWYLPSKYELNLLYLQKLLVGGFNTSGGIYWSSTESTTDAESLAWEQEFKFGSQHEDDKDMPDQVRCIRKF